MIVSEDGRRLHGDEVRLEGEPEGAEIVDEGEGAVDAEVLQPLVAQQGPVGHEQRVELGPVLRVRRVLDVLNRLRM